MRRLARVDNRYTPRFSYTLLRGLKVQEYDYLSPLLLILLLRHRYDAYLACSLANPDCLIAFLIAKCFRRPFILWEERWERTRSSISRLIEPIQRLVARSADFIIVPGSRSFEYLSTMTGRRNRLVIAPNASWLEKPSQARVTRFRRLCGIPSDKKVVLYLGRLITAKGLDYLLLSYAKLEADFKDAVFLLIAGEGEERSRLNLLADILNIRNIRFADFVDDQAACLSVADVVVLPTVSGDTSSHIPETWGLVVNEAACLGIPVVVTRAVGCADDLVRQSHCGFVVQERNAEELLRAIRNVVLNPKLAVQMGANGIRITDETFSYEMMFEKFCSAIQHALRETE
jgi:glycosyltransferase involved in cell wall biosynthesis